MPTYGPWQEGRIHEEILSARTGATSEDDSTVQLLSEAPTQGSGWVLTNFAGFWRSTGSVSRGFEGGLDDPPPEDAAQSLEAWLQAIGQPVNDGGATFQHQIERDGNRQPFGVMSWFRSYVWDLQGVMYEISYQGQPFISSPDLAVPIGFPIGTDDYYVELEPLAQGQEALAEVVEAEVLPMVGAPVHRLHYKDAGDTSAFLTQGPTSVAASRGKPSAPGPLNIDAMMVLQNEVEDGRVVMADDPRWPRLSVLYDGPDMNDATFGGGTVSTFAGGQVAVKIRYRMPRWRQVFFDVETPSVPYRRVYPRDDGRAGGSAPRTWPPSKAVQSSNRTFGGYV